MATISAAIMSHPSRQHEATLLARRLDCFNPVVVLDPAPDEEPSALRAAAEAWALAGSADYHLVLQDDVVPCRDFTSLLGHCAERSPTPVTALFADWASANGQSVRLAALRGDSYAPMVQASVPPQGLLTRRDEAQRLARECARAVAAGRTRDSQLVWEFAVRNGPGACLAVPNLVQHDIAESASIWPLKVRRGPIRSACFADDVRGPIDFRTPRSLPGDLVPYVNWKQQAVIATPARAEQRSEQVPALEWLLSAGYDAAGLVGEFRQVLAPHRDGLRPLSQPLLFEVYLACVATVRLGHRVDHMCSSCSSAALETMLSGAARNTADLSSCPRIVAAAREYVAHALHDREWI